MICGSALCSSLLIIKQRIAEGLSLLNEELPNQLPGRVDQQVRLEVSISSFTQHQASVGYRSIRAQQSYEITYLLLGFDGKAAN
jgi:hypothetical protein